MGRKDNRSEGLPDVAVLYIRSVARRVGNTHRVRREVVQEFIDHFNDALRECTDEAARDQRVAELIEQFGDPKLLGKLIRRSKKRCRPLWKKTLIRSFQTVGALFLLLHLYLVWVNMGTPTISVDYVKVINDRARPNVPTSENAWEDYERAMELYVEPPDIMTQLGGNGNSPLERVNFAKLPVEQQGAIRKWINDNAPAWKELSAGSRKRQCWVEYRLLNEATDPLLTFFLPNLNSLRELGRVGVWRCEVGLSEGRVDEAIEDCLAVIRVGGHLQRPRSWLIEQIVGIGISALGHEQFLRAADSGRLSASQLMWAQAELEAPYQDGYPLMDLDIEKFILLDVVQRCYTDGGIGGGHFIPTKSVQLGLYRSDDIGAWAMIIGAGLHLYPTRDEIVRHANDYYKRAQEMMGLSPYEQRKRGLEESSDAYLGGPALRSFPLWVPLLPSFQRAAELNFRAKALHEATVTVLALRRWALEKGQYPETLDELVKEGYLKALPDDPYSGNDVWMHQISSDIDLWPMVNDHWYLVKVVFNSDKSGSGYPASNGTVVDIFLDDQGTDGNGAGEAWVGYVNASKTINGSSSCRWGSLPGDFIDTRDETSHIGASWNGNQIFEGLIDWVTWKDTADYTGVDDPPY